MTPEEFVHKWRHHSLNEIQSAQPFFLDLCALVEHPTPAQIDPMGDFFTFEKRVRKIDGTSGRADVWYKDHFAIEVKERGKDLTRAYRQLLEYRDDLANPPLLVVTDTFNFRIYTNFTGTVGEKHELTIEDFRTSEGMRILRALFYNPDSLKPQLTTAQVTESAAREFGNLAAHMRRWGTPADEIAHYLIRLLFILFAEDVDLLPHGLFTRIVEGGQRNPSLFNRQMTQLFHAMAEGDVFGEVQVRWFNGGLFNDAPIIELDSQALAVLQRVSGLDWSAIEPSILGTLFVRSLDPSKRAQLGAHYTSEEDILLIVEPVLMRPLRREWGDIQTKARQLATERDAAANRSQRARKQNELDQLLSGFSMRIQQTRVLDPACGSGNFLYVALRLLLDLEKELIYFCGEVQVQPFFPQVTPAQLFGIEINEYAHELAQATVWIGYLQWLHANGYGVPGEPILKSLDNIKQMDAILAYDAEGNPTEPEWPEADVIVGNPPFLGAIKHLSELGESYMADIKAVYDSRVPLKSDLVCYWFERARLSIAEGRSKRGGLLATQSIRKGLSRTVLDRIKESGDIFFAESDRPWIVEGASVRVSMVGFDDGRETTRRVDGIDVENINSDLSVGIDVTTAKSLAENAGILFPGTKKYGPFEVTGDVARDLLQSKNHGDYDNADVVKPWINGSDIAGRRRGLWIIDFGVNTSRELAECYEAPFAYVEEKVKPARSIVRVESTRNHWWLFERPRPELRRAIVGLDRFIVTPQVSKHRLFTFVKVDTVPDTQVFVFARSDLYFLGVLQSIVHEVWTLCNCSWKGVGNDPTYLSSTCFDTYPFPWPPGNEPTSVAMGGGEKYFAISAASADLVRQRDAWLNPPNLSETELKKRTLTNLYNAITEEKSFDKAPDKELILAIKATHERLDRAVHAAYGWEYPLPDEEILARLLALNLERAATQKPPPER